MKTNNTNNIYIKKIYIRLDSCKDLSLRRNKNLELNFKEKNLNFFL